ncbi:hypothetical protein WT25_00925 [Burkholderia territorii]|nr:hypothetical protein WS79_01695 [Burkholderia territorii]KVT85776.1 hypothetical protein WT25_00925 [Burkholderia territorii]VWB73470.1 hypothetical protein BTE28158_03463 [Burkholderia territorii]
MMCGDLALAITYTRLHRVHHVACMYLDHALCCVVARQRHSLVNPINPGPISTILITKHSALDLAGLFQLLKLYADDGSWHTEVIGQSGRLVRPSGLHRRKNMQGIRCN